MYDCDLHKMTALEPGQGLSRYLAHLPPVSVAHRGDHWAPRQAGLGPGAD